MSDDLISKQAAIDALDKQIKLCDKALASFDISMKDEYAVKAERASLVAYRERLKYLPSADVVEVVRCKDCKYWYDAPADDGFNICEMDAMVRNENFFCANGE